AGDAVDARQLEAMRLVLADLRAREPADVEHLFRIDGDRLAEALAVEPEHDVAGKRPGLARVILHRADGYARLLEHLASHRLLQRLARLNEAGERGVHVRPREPLRMAEQHLVAAGHQ